MKNLFKSSMLVAIVAAALVGCSKDTTETNAPVVKGTTVHFKAEVADDTDGSRASLTPDQDETLFTAAWEKTDEIGISAKSKKGDDIKDDYNLCGTRKNDVFSTTFLNCPDSADLWDYYAYYPYTANASTDYNITIPFGGERIQYGNDYNSAYDIMAADTITIDIKQPAAAGKDDKGNPLVFAMHRLTAIAYFHFTTTASAKSDKVLSVTLSATPSVAEEPLAADEVSLFYGNETKEKKHSCVAKTGAANSIKITYDPATAPTAADFKAWFNVLPGSFSDVKITIETENYTATITRTGDVLYEAGKLYKVSPSIAESKWQAKAADYSGTYLILAKPATGNYWYLVPNATNDYQTAKDTNTAELGDFSDIATDENAWVVVKNDDKYIISSLSLSNSENRFIGGAASGKSNYAKLVAEGSAESVNITKKDDGTYLIATTSLSTTKYLALNTSATPKRFAFYNEQTRNLVLIPYVSTPKIAPSVSSVTVSPVAGNYEDITYKTPGFETKPVVNVECDGTVVTEAEDVDGTIMYTVSANTTGAERTTGKITLSADGAESVTITVMQESNLIGHPETVTITEIGATTFKANWTAVTHAATYDWELYKGEDNSGDLVGMGTASTNSIEITSLPHNDISVTTEFATGKYVLYVKSATADEGYTISEADATKSNVYEFSAGGTIVPDVLTADLFEATGSSYAEFADVTVTSNAVYAGKTAKDSSGNIQLRSKNSDCGIVTTTSGGNVRKIVVTWGSNTDSGRALDIYGSNTAFTAASALYATATQGTKIGSIVYGTSTTLEVTDDYKYIGLRSKSGAMYITKIEITYEN